MSLWHHGNSGTAYGLEAVTPETQQTTTTTQAFGGEELQLSTVPFTLAPNVKPPNSVPVDRRDTGYVSLERPAMSRLATPEEFNCSTRSQVTPVSERFSGDSHDQLRKMRAPKNVTFRGVRGRGYKNYSSSSDASDEDFSNEPNGDCGGHLGGGAQSPAT